MTHLPAGCFDPDVLAKVLDDLEKSPARAFNSDIMEWDDVTPKTGGELAERKKFLSKVLTLYRQRLLGWLSASGTNMVVQTIPMTGRTKVCAIGPGCSDVVFPTPMTLGSVINQRLRFFTAMCVMCGSIHELYTTLAGASSSHSHTGSVLYAPQTNTFISLFTKDYPKSWVTNYPLSFLDDMTRVAGVCQDCPMTCVECDDPVQLENWNYKEISLFKTSKACRACRSCMLWNITPPKPGRDERRRFKKALANLRGGRYA
jgi:hypothetical protein